MGLRTQSALRYDFISIKSTYLMPEKAALAQAQNEMGRFISFNGYAFPLSHYCLYHRRRVSRASTHYATPMADWL